MTLSRVEMRAVIASGPAVFRVRGALPRRRRDVLRTSADASVASQIPDVEYSALKQHTWVWNGHKTVYVTAGCGRPVVLVHGFGASSGHYRRTIPALAKQYKVYAVDLLGFGGSEKPILDYSMELWEQQLTDFMAEFLDGQKAVVVGNSVGSLATLMVAASLPERVGGVVLLNCAGGMNNKAIADDWRIKLAMPIFLLVDWLLRRPNIARRLFDNVRQTDALAQILKGVYPKNPDAVDDELVSMLHGPSCDPGALETFVSVITGPPGPRPEQLIPRVEAPILLVWGDADSFTPSDGPVGQYFQRLANERPNTSFHHLPGVGHCPMDEAPDDVHAVLLPWLEEHHSVL